MKTSSSGAGMSKRSPYISSCGSSKYSGRPSAIGWPGSTTQMRSFSPTSRHFRSQPVPISLRKILDKCPECRTISPMPSRTRFWHARDDLVFHLAVRHVPPPGEDVGFGEDCFGQAVFWLIEGGGADGEARGL